MTHRMDFAGFDLRTRHETARKSFRDAERDWLDSVPVKVNPYPPLKLGLAPFVLGCVLGGPLQFGIYVIWRLM